LITGLSNITQAPVAHPTPPLPPIGDVAGTMPGMWLLIIVFLFGTIILILVVAIIAVKIWGNPMLVAKSSRLSGDAIIEHFEAGKNGFLKLARIEGHAMQHREVKDGTLITIPQGISNLDGHHVILSWGLFGVGVPIFLLAGITKLKSLGFNTRAEIEAVAEAKPSEEKPADEITQDFRSVNLITEGYNFNDLRDVVTKSKSPVYLPLEIEHTSDFVRNVNQHYTEGDVSDDLEAYQTTIEDDFGRTIFLTAISVLVVSVAMWLMLGQGGGG